MHNRVIYLRVRDYDNGHNLFAPSAAHRWLHCPASPRAEANAPKVLESVSSYAVEGSAVHSLCEHLLKRTCDKIEHHIGKWLDYNGQLFEITKEMAKAVKAYTDYIAGVQYDGVVTHALRTEMSLKYNGIKGTADAVVVPASCKFGHVVDLKYGAGYAVEVKENPQLMVYGLGAGELWPALDKLNLVIAQPRAFHADGPIRKWEVAMKDLRAWGAEKVLPAVDSALQENPEAKAGKWCKWCKAEAYCPERLRSIKIAAGAKKLSDINKCALNCSGIDKDKIRRYLDAAGDMSSWISAVKGTAAKIIKIGESIDGWGLEVSTPSRRINPEADFLDLEFLDVDPYKKVLKGIGELETELSDRKVKKAEIDGIMKDITVRGAPSAPRLVRMSEEKSQAQGRKLSIMQKYERKRKI